VEGFPEDLPVKWVAPENEDPKMYLQARATEELRALAEQAACPDAALQVVFCDRGPCREITRYAKEQGVDLIIMSSRGHQGIKRNLGSKVGTVIDDADCDVLTVHSAE
jgi:nucleotide-binding universal stress UspA family protein